MNKIVHGVLSACWISAVLLGLVVVLVAAPRAGAQANRATITGIVTDSSGAVVPGVEVTTTNAGTNVSSKTVSNGDGIYVVPNLFPGTYSVEFVRGGFDTVLRPAVALSSTEVARLDIVLHVGATSATVTVTSGAPILDLDTASVGTNMKADVVNDLPLSIYGGGRFIENFAVAITPGYSLVSSPYGATINGGQWFTKDYTIDGTSGTSNVRGDSMDGGPSMEAVQEVQAQTSGLDAQSAITGGGVMAFSLKSGTNSLHGSAFTYGANELFDANTWTNDSLNEPKGKRRAWDYGFSLGGPIRKNRTFFFGTFERYTQVDWRMNSGGATVPTAAMLGGNFSGVLGQYLWTDGNGNVMPCAPPNCTGLTPIMVKNNAGQSIQAQQDMIYDPLTGNQFTGNVIPPGRLSAVAQKVNTFYSSYAPNLGGVTNNERTPLASVPSQTPNWYVIKLDHVLGNNDHLSGSWIYDHKPRTDAGGLWQAGSSAGGPLSNSDIRTYHQNQYRISESHTFTPHLLNVLNFTDTFDYNAAVPASPGDWNSQVGFGNTGADNFPQISFTDGQTGINETYMGNTWQGHVSGAVVTTGDTVTWNKGRHTLTFGGEFVAHEINNSGGTKDSGAYSFDFSYLNTAGPGYPYDGFGFATYELGLVSQASESVAYNLYGRQKEIDLFAQDSFKVSSKLTVNMGLRWNYNTRFHEKNGNWANFDPTVVDQQLTAVYGAALPGSLVFAKGGGDSFDKYEYARNFGPTLGIAYQLQPKVVVRASYGLIFNPVGISFFGGVPDGFAPQIGSNTATSFDWDNPSGGGYYPGVLSKATLATDPSTMLPFPVETDPRSLRLGYSEAFNLGVQQQLTPNMRLEIAYVGNRGHRLTDTALAWNETSTQKFLKLLNSNPGYSIWNWMYCQYGDTDINGVSCPYPNFNGPALAALAPLPQMAGAEMTYWYGCCANLNYAGLPLGQSFYDSLVVDVVKQTGRGLTMDMNYGWSRQEGDSFSSEQDYNNGYSGVEDFQNMRGAAHALTGFDLPQVVKGFVTYELPFGQGQRWGASFNRALRSAVGGWQTSGLVSYYTGQPFRVGAANPYWPLWADIYPQFNLNSYKGPTHPGHYVPVGSGGTVPAQDYYMSSAVASNPAAGYLPPSPYTSRLRCPGQANENVTFLKNNRVGPDGKYNLSMRMDFYNAFNRHYYNIQGCGGTSASIGSPTFGEILGVQDNPREGQFAIRLDF
jgi:hypothetical protein